MAVLLKEERWKEGEELTKLMLQSPRPKDLKIKTLFEPHGVDWSEEGVTMEVEQWLGYGRLHPMLVKQ